MISFRAITTRRKRATDELAILESESVWAGRTRLHGSGIIEGTGYPVGEGIHDAGCEGIRSE